MHDEVMAAGRIANHPEIKVPNGRVEILFWIIKINGVAHILLKGRALEL